MSPETPTARELARRLVEREATGADTPDALLAAVHGACERLCLELTRWVGADGRDALFTRALSQARTEHLALASIHLHSGSDPCLEGVAESLQAHGVAAAAEGLESMLMTLIELLGRLIGSDMAQRLVEMCFPNRARGDASPEAGGARRRDR